MVEEIKTRSVYMSKERIIIGFLGTDSGVGTTHLSVATATFLASELGKTVALLELGEKPVLQCLMHRSYDTFFTVDGVRYYPHARPELISELCSTDIQYLILDLGRGNGQAVSEFFRCDKRYIVSSFVPWKREGLEQFVCRYADRLSKNNVCCAVLTLDGYDHEKRRFSRMHRLPIRTIPYIADPFWLVSDQLPFFYDMI